MSNNPNQGGYSIDREKIIKDPVSLERSLHNLLNPDNVIRSKYSVLIKEFVSHPESLLAFVHLLDKSTSIDIRLLSSILMRMKMKELWRKISATGNNRNYIKNKLLEILMREKKENVRASIIYCIGEIASFELCPVAREDMQVGVKRGWNEVLTYTVKCVNSKNQILIDNGIRLFLVLLEKCADYLPLTLFKTIGDVLLFGLAKNKNPKILKICLQTMDFYVKRVGAIIKRKPRLTDSLGVCVFQLIPPLVNVMKVSISSKNLEFFFLCISVFHEFGSIHTTHMRFLSLLPNLVKWFIDITGNTNLDLLVRDKTSLFLGMVLLHNPKVIINNKLDDVILNLTFKLLVTPTPKTDTDEFGDLRTMYDPQFDQNEYDTTNLSMYKSGSALLDQYCNQLPSILTFDKLLKAALSIINKNYECKRAALTIMGIFAEGCNEKVKANLNLIVPIVVQEYDKHKGDERIRRLVFQVVINFSEYCQPEFSKYHKLIMPLLIKGLNDPSNKIKATVCLSIESYCFEMEPNHLLPHAEILLNILFHLLKVGSLIQQENALSSISSIAEALKQEFLPYFHTSMNIMEFIIKNCDKNTISLRSRAMECVGLLGKSVGKNAYAPYINKFIQYTVMGLTQIEDNEYRELCCCFIRNTAKCLGPDFAHYTKMCHDLVMIVMSLPDGTLIRKGPTVLGQESSEINVLTNKDFGKIDLTEFRYNILPSAISMKSQGCLCLGQIAESVGFKFFPFYVKTLQSLVNLTKHIAHKVRKSAYRAIRTVVLSCVTIPIADNNPNRKLFLTYLNSVIKMYIDALQEEVRKPTVESICYALMLMIKRMKGYIFGNHLTNLQNAIVNVLKRRTKCFMCDEEKFQGNLADHDDVVFERAMDLFDHTIQMMNNPQNKLNFYKRIFPIHLDYIKRNSLEDRAIVIGSISEVATALGPMFSPFLPQLFDHIIKGATTQPKNLESPIQRNSVYCIGCLTPCKEVFAKKLQPICQILHSILQTPQNFKDFVVDNCCGSLSKILITQRLAMQTYDPLFRLLLNNMPLKSDFIENQNVYQCLFVMVKNSHPLVGKYLKDIVSNFLYAISNENRLSFNLSTPQDSLKALNFVKQKFDLKKILSCLIEKERNMLLSIFSNQL